ncbi:MAG: sigma-70 family RNA polymerase sigma factor [Candidatus Riflemargulisbacteria bacterium]
MSIKTEFSRKEMSGWGDYSDTTSTKFEFKNLPNVIDKQVETLYKNRALELINVILVGLHLEEAILLQKKYDQYREDTVLKDIKLVELLERRALKKLTDLLAGNFSEELSRDSLRELAIDIKEYLICRFSEMLFEQFDYKIGSLVNNYLRKLPGFMKTSDKDDLMNIARLEFLQTLRVWEPLDNPAVWPFAYSRINGAMRDYIRYLTKADPTRLYTWISDAAYMYIGINKHYEEFSGRIESKVTLRHAMESLTEMERKIVTLKTVNDLTLMDIGEKVGLSESQISRIYRASVEKLKKILKPE